MKYWSIMVAAGLLGLSACTPAESSNPEAEAAAIKAAEAWAALLDAGKYDEGWDAAATFYRNAVPKDKSSAGLKAARAPMGKMVSREVKSTTYRTSMPGAPDGEYVIVQFNTSLENKEKAVETITPMLDNGVWKVSGYYIK